ncbi:hypothetical protein [Polyangium sorediatum]|uniref:Lipoprotein n=1 Tax=Polyangium sorediatum TaxID=889274 RepID=A0ABT6NX10_9BACT|nr:hypothetical protein [Polyangium sorediatum]MDI1432876.1 hypothetical protein [Polyangium sorediatum]
MRRATFSPRLLGPAALVLLAACSKDATPPAPATESAAPAAAPAPSEATPAPSEAAPTPTPETTAAAAPEKPKNIVRSSRPTPLEWCQAPMAKLGWEGYEEGEFIQACKMLEVREWVLIGCPTSGQREYNKSLGGYNGASPGGGSMATKEEILAANYGWADAVVISLRPGTKAKPAFNYRPYEHPEQSKDETFSFEMPENASGLEDRLFNGGRWPAFKERDTSRCEEMAATAKAEAAAKAEADAKAQAQEDAKILPDVEGLAAAPADEALAAEKEVLVTGSGAVGCKTKIVESWFWMRCEGKVKITALDIERGRRQTQTKASAEEGVGKLLVPYVEGTDLRAKLTFEGGEKFLKLRWPKGKRPFQVGTIGETR